MPWPTLLLRLQDIDLEFQKINQRLTDIEASLKNRTKLDAAEAQAARTAKAAKAARQAQSELEFELNRVQDKLRQTEARLYGGSIVNARELQDLQAESKSLKKRKAKLEDDLLEAMMAQEERAEAAEAAQAQVEKIQQELDSSKKAWIQEREQLIAHGKSLLEEAETLKADIPEDTLDSYRYLKDRTNNMPVSQLKNGICTMCGIEVLKPTQRQVLKGELAYCDGCRRILVE